MPSIARPATLVVLSLALPAPAPAAEPEPVRVYNLSERTLVRVETREAGGQRWGANALGSASLPAGEIAPLAGVRCGVQDVRLVDSTGTACVLSGVDPCADGRTWRVRNDDFRSCGAGTGQPAAAGPSPSPSPSGPTPKPSRKEARRRGAEEPGRIVSVTLVNASEWTVRMFRLSRTSESGWGKDRLGGDPLEPKESVTLEGIPCGRYDAQAVLEDESACVIGDVDLCRRSSWTITNADLAACRDLGR